MQPFSLMRRTACRMIATALAFSGAGAGAADVRVEILVHGSAADPTSHYDYVTWAPAPALIRVVPSGETATGTVTVVLTNAEPASDGRGHVNFAANADDYRQAVESGAGGLDQMTLTLKADGTPQPFVVAGAFPHFSREDKDTTIVAHQSSATGPELDRAPLMVRVRRNEETLTEAEKARFLWALAALRFRKTEDGAGSVYDFLVHMHDVGARGMPAGNAPAPTDYPDQEHKSSGFLPWHRAFLLELERALQSVDPSVALPYWPMYLAPEGKPAAVFHADFTGANSVLGGTSFFVPELTEFDFGNPLHGWDIEGRGALMRWTTDRTDLHIFNKPGDLIDGNVRKGRYAFAAGSIEADPHNIGHNWSGVWMSNCRISPSDPMFWPFHAYFDWLWAAWQQHYDRFDKSGRDEAQYWPGDRYQDGSQLPLGHHLKDTMWPWNGESQPTPVSAFNARRPPEKIGGPFAAATVPDLWPQQPAAPTPGDLIDYGGYRNRADDEGVAYDTIPWSPKQKSSPFPGDARPVADALATLLDPARPAALRAARAAKADLLEAAEPGRLSAIEAVAVSSATPPAVKAAAIELLTRVDTAAAIETAFKLPLDDRDAKLSLALERARDLRMFANRPLDIGARAYAPAKAATAVSAQDSALYAKARDGVPDNDPDIVAMMTVALKEFLAAPTQPVRQIPPQDAAAFIAATNLFEKVPAVPGDAGMAMDHAQHGAPMFSQAETLEVMREILGHAPVYAPGVLWWKTAKLAATVLAHDPSPDSRRLIQALIKTASAPTDSRAAALNSLRHQDAASFETTAFDLAGDKTAPTALRAEAIAAIGAYVMDRSFTLSPADIARLNGNLAKLPADLSPEIRKALQATRRLVALAAG